MVGEPDTAPVKNANPVVTQPTPAATPTITVEPKESILKKWWFWTIIAIIIVLGIGAYFLL
jgi:hypothetical protein